MVPISYYMTLILERNYWAGKSIHPFIIISWNFKLHTTIAELKKRKEQKSQDRPGSDQQADVCSKSQGGSLFLSSLLLWGEGTTCSQSPKVTS